MTRLVGFRAAWRLIQYQAALKSKKIIIAIKIILKITRAASPGNKLEFAPITLNHFSRFALTRPIKKILLKSVSDKGKQKKINIKIKLN